MQLGTTYDESAVLPDQDADLLQTLAFHGISSLEFAFLPLTMINKRIKALLKNTSELGFSFAFHAPDFLDPAAFDLNEVMSDGGNHALKSYAEWFAACASTTDNAQLIVHGAYASDKSFRFFDWALETIEQKRYNLTLLLENTWSKLPGQVRFGQWEADLIRFSEFFHGAPTGLCLDTAHWIRTQNDLNEMRNKNTATTIYNFDDPTFVSSARQYPFKTSKALIPRVKRVHIHEIDPSTGIDHQGIALAQDITAELLIHWFSAEHKTLSPCSVLSLEVLKSSLYNSGRLEETTWEETVLQSVKWLKTLNL